MSPKDVALRIENITNSCEEVCRIHEQIPFDEERIGKLAKKLRAISHPTRLKIIFLAMKYDEITTCELENALNINQSKVSYHLLNLLDSDIVERRTYGPWSFYRLKDKVGIFEMFRVIGLDEDTLQTFV